MIRDALSAWQYEVTRAAGVSAMPGYQAGAATAG
ncbi:hypothetical protein LAUMK7_05447 [Mycobacterium kansasii]|uniref:Uncharacterized protein n=2 Tax=Mycobacterium kansasii TaxID=1768 RepID=A0A653F2K8_MYCKA|nr:hypothetical protein MKANGN_56390 [Mycobacterium kansasii]VAZ62989.1 hypothetical protein LAUMK22_04818 [Mycobacterium kansasii]VAZ69409.1 hypothetical protein LAUMK40_05570 [Mycobacterium kansasii]VAZ80638.1 hypothetical protein LAUMK7_05447 [Mycobacterium kansasii]VTP04015.1 hypothetical protein BIN_B_04218 [Mycobacterium kansasii]